MCEAGIDCISNTGTCGHDHLVSIILLCKVYNHESPNILCGIYCQVRGLEEHVTKEKQIIHHTVKCHG